MRMWQIQPRAEAPRRRQKWRKPRPDIVCRSTWIWLRTGSIYGTPVIRNYANFWFICMDDGAKTLCLCKKCWSWTSDQGITAILPGLHPGERCSLSPGKESPGTRDSCSIQSESNLSADGVKVGGVIVVSTATENLPIMAIEKFQIKEKNLNHPVSSSRCT